MVQVGDVMYKIVACGYKQATLEDASGRRKRRDSSEVRKLFATEVVNEEAEIVFADDEDAEEVDAEVVDAEVVEDEEAVPFEEEDDEEEEAETPAKKPRTETKTPKKKREPNRNREIFIVDARKGSPSALAPDGKLPDELVYRTRRDLVEVLDAMALLIDGGEMSDSQALRLPACQKSPPGESHPPHGCSHSAARPSCGSSRRLPVAANLRRRNWADAAWRGL